MALTAIKTKTAASQLHIIKGPKEYEQQLQTLTGLAWQIAYTALWNGEQFSLIEKEKAAALINDFIKQKSNPRKAYAEFAQRVLLARQYILSHPGSYAPLPSEWLSPANKNGFAGTERWYASVENMRRSLPLYKQSLRAFPEAILETTQTGNAKDFHYWRKYFGENNAQSLLNLFLSTMSNCTWQ